MILGLSIATFTIIHVVISLVAIVSGVIVVIGMLGKHRMPGWTALFLMTTILTTATGFMFPIKGFTPALGTGIVSSVLLLVALVALYGKELGGSWRWIYVTTAVAALYLNVFVLIVQAFEKVRFINPLAPQVGPPFAEPTNTYFLIAQAAALVLFVGLGIAATRRFRPRQSMLAP